jgi:LPXTG-motif cell wall-anchored protein
MVAGAVILVGALAGRAEAEHVEPILIEETASQTCGDFAEEFGGGQMWLEVKLDPASPGVEEINVEGFGTITVTVDENTKVVDWEADFGIDAVFLKAGAAGSHLYVYAPTAEAAEETSDMGLTTPGEGEMNQISHISFCYDEDQPPPTTDTTAPTTETTAPTTETTAPTTETTAPTTETTAPTTETTAPTTETTEAPTETTEEAPPTEELPRTGSSSGPMVALGAGLLAVGAGLVGATRLMRRMA